MTTRPKVNVLLVDDQPSKLLSYEAVLRELDENLIKAGSAREALELLLRNDIGVILIDVCMPEFDGFDLVDMIREHPRFDSTPIILVSAVFMSDVDRIRGYQRGAMDYVSVPIVPEILRAKVAAFADLHRKTRQLEQLNAQLEERVAERTAELEAAAARLRAGEERLSLAMAAGSVATWDWDIGGDRVYGDERLSFYFAVTEDEVSRGLPVERLLEAVHEEDRPATRTRLHELVVSGTEYVMQFRVRSSDGNLHWMRASGRVQRDARGRGLRVLGALTDITEHIRMENALREADRRKDRFLAVLSHELRNPLAAVRNAVELMRLGAADSSTVSWGRDMIERQIKQLVRLVDDLLDVSRITEGKLKLQRQPVDLATVVAGAVDTCRPQIDRDGHTLTLHLPPEPVWVRGDTARLTQVVTNLLSNAAKYQERGGQIALTVGHEGEQALISVKDRGQGIAPELLPRVFDMFTQAADGGERAGEGLGLGLSVVKQIVELHAGSVEARSGGRGEGSDFVVRLPRLLEVQPSPAPSREVHPPSAGPGLRILVVDDNHDAAESLGLLLRGVGHEVTLAHEGETALALAPSVRPAVVLLDLGLPGIDGLELCRRLRQQGLGEALMVAITGYGQESDRKRTCDAGFDRHLVKPVAFDVLVELLESVRDQAPLLQRQASVRSRRL
jgi:signal transduction histidine kinase